MQYYPYKGSFKGIPYKDFSFEMPTHSLKQKSNREDCFIFKQSASLRWYQPDQVQGSRNIVSYLSRLYRPP